MYIVKLFHNIDPLPYLPPRGKELIVSRFPLGGNKKGGHPYNKEVDGRLFTANLNSLLLAYNN